MIETLAHRAFQIRQRALDVSPDVVVDPAVPVLYFGDLEGYLDSSLRVVTVALNPSKAEFPPEDPFSRFPLAIETSQDLGGYLAALSSYFKTDPYKRWFSSFEPLLNGLDSSYYPGATNTALHTDLCSPVATDPTWSRLQPSTKANLIQEGSPLWHHLIRQLRPDLILISLARRHLGKIDFPTSGEVIEIDRLVEGRRRPYVTEGWRIRIDEETNPLVVFGRAANQPFGFISNKYKEGLGQRIVERLADTDELLAVQFPHPGGEHVPDRPGWKDWNTGGHRRKFMKVEGRWRASTHSDADDTPGELVFWGEWEPPSAVVAELPGSGRGWPSYVYEPVLTEVPDIAGVQNTDPFVFGQRFLYSNCRQNKATGPLRTQKLARGSVILFGSGLGGEFVLDTVFVVARSHQLTQETVSDLVVDPAFRRATLDPLFRGEGDQTYRLYEGATSNEPVSAMFSFFPCLPASEGLDGFARPHIEVDGVVNPRSWQGVKFTAFHRVNEIRRTWEEVVGQVLSQGLVLGTYAPMPEPAYMPSNHWNEDVGGEGMLRSCS